MDTLAQPRLNPDDLVTHGMIVGMTGSGKTGLAIGLLEELALAGVPLIVVDLKGDLTNLGLVLPEQRAALGGPPGPDQPEWRSKVRLRLYTPGSEAVRPVSVLGSLAPPAAPDRDDLVTATVLGLLSLVGKQCDALQDPEPILMSQIVAQAWDRGEALSLEALITQVVDPPFPRVGVFPVDTFMPPDERLALARLLNGIVASPSFAPWAAGEPLDIAELVKTPISLFYLAHLSDAERMFFLSILLERILDWTRTLGGSSSLRALVYMDEVAGYLPPVSEPPTKKPVLTLLKQARGVGVGLLLATQNPVDLDYKAMSNTGSWWIGKLQTTQDQNRVAEGLRCQRDLFDRLEKRVFLYKPARQEALQLVRTRDTLSWLRGPLTLPELSRLEPPAPAGAPPAKPSDDTPAGLPAPPPLRGIESCVLDRRVVFSARLEGRFERYAEPARQDGRVKLAPALYARVEARFDEAKTGFREDHVESRVYFPLTRGVRGEFHPVALDEDDLMPAPDEPAVYELLPAELDELGEWEQARKDILDDIYRNLTRSQWVNGKLKLYGLPGETREAFESRCRKLVEEKIDARADQLREKFRTRGEQLKEKIRTQRARLAELRSEASSRKTESYLNVGETLLGFFTGRKRSLNTVVSKSRMASSADQRAERAEDDLEELVDKEQELIDELQDQLDRIRAEEERALDATEERSLRLDRKDLRLDRLCLLWIPVSRRL